MLLSKESTPQLSARSSRRTLRADRFISGNGRLGLTWGRVGRKNGCAEPDVNSPCHVRTGSRASVKDSCQLCTSSAICQICMEIGTHSSDDCSPSVSEGYKLDASELRAFSFGGVRTES